MIYIIRMTKRIAIKKITVEEALELCGGVQASFCAKVGIIPQNYKRQTRGKVVLENKRGEWILANNEEFWNG